MQGLECPPWGFPSPCAPGKAFPGLQQDLLASEHGIPCSSVPHPLALLGSVSRSCSVLPSCLLGVPTCTGWAQLCVSPWVFIHTFGSCEKPGRGHWEHRELALISKSSQARFLGDGSGTFRAVAVPTWALVWGSGDPLCQLLLGTARAKPDPSGQSWAVPGPWHCWPGWVWEEGAPWAWGKPWGWQCPHHCHRAPLPVSLAAE